MSGESVQLFLGLDPGNRCEFDNYLASESNGPVVQQLQELAKGSGAESLYLVAETGGGLSHLLQATGYAAIENGLSCQYLPLESLAEETVAIIRGMIDHADEYDLVVVDDLEQLVGNEQAEEQLFHLHNRVINSGGRLVYGARTPPSRLNMSLADLRSRLSALLVLGLTPLDDDDKMLVILERARARGFELEQGVADYLLNYGSRQIGDLVSYVNTLEKASLHEKRRVTLPFVRKVLANELHRV